MLLRAKDGVRCDSCGMIFKDQFTYYSEEWRAIDVSISNQTVRQGSVIGTYDICQPCYDALVEKCKKFINAFKQNFVKCDTCPSYVSGSKFTYYKISIDKVDVKIGQYTHVDRRHMDFNICENCKIAEFAKRQQLKTKGDWS